MTDTVYFPDYTHSILNISNTILKHYGVKTDYPALPLLARALKAGYKNVVLWILDGMGVDMITHNLSAHSFLRQHIIDEVSSVFPPTTTSATTTYYSALPPAVHGWVGWSPYFPEANRYIELFTGKDSFTKEDTGISGWKNLPYQHLFDQIQATGTNLTCTEIMPKKIRPNGVETFQEQARSIIAQAKQDGRQFIVAYWADPDHTAHHTGTYSADTIQVLRDLNHTVRQACTRLQDTLVIISADHGHIPISDFVMINDLPELKNCLAHPINMDDRVCSVFLKKGAETTFKKAFEKYLAKDFMLLRNADAIKQKLFGPGEPHPRLKEYLGDYLIIATGERVLRQRIGEFTSGPLTFKSAHAGLTKREMVVPLILVQT